MTKAQRHKYYRTALRIVKKDVKNCICWSLEVATNFKKKRSDFPEFMRYRPNNWVTMWMKWWPFNKRGQKNRIEILNKIIKETAPKTRRGRSS